MARKIIIIGGGIIGAMIADRLSGAGEVTVLDAGRPGATTASFGWINASFHHDVAHFHLRARSMELWRASGLPVTWSGALWWEAQGTEMDNFAERLAGLGYAVERVEDGPGGAALRFPEEGFVEAGDITAMLLSRSGARVLRGVTARAVETRNGAVTGVVVEGGTLPADHVVIAAGNGAPTLAEGVGLHLPMLDRPGVMLRTSPVAPGLVPHVMVAPEMEFRQDAQGRLLAPTSPNHQGDATERLTQTAQAYAVDALARLGGILGRDDLALETVWQANRPVPGDGLPVIGTGGPEGLFWAVMHSGVTLAPVAAEAVVAAMEAEAHALAAPYGIDRFQSG